MVVVCTDNDANGTGQRAASEAAERFLREDRRVHTSTSQDDADSSSSVQGTLFERTSKSSRWCAFGVFDLLERRKRHCSSICDAIRSRCIE